jgi:uncharacterized protein YoxC
MTVVELAAIVAAIALCVLVALAAGPMVKLGRTLDETREAVARISDATMPVLQELQTAAEGATHELERLAAVTEDAGKVAARAADVTEDAAQFSHLMGAALGKPLVKTAAFTYGVRKAIEGNRK